MMATLRILPLILGLVATQSVDFFTPRKPR
jgi:hypothetical protein